jgi:crotonobetainyl-CoA:carnitine CoA-transferase CaiB-like acyl-CoA transferase
MAAPLEGLRVLDCSHGMAGPRATGVLADYGADVVWVEPPGGDPCRPHVPGAMSVFNRGKRSVVLDVTTPQGRSTVLELAERADVFVESWRPGAADQLGLGYDVMHRLNPRLVYVSISGFGERGRDADADLPGFEPIVQALLGGMADQVGHRTGPIFLGFPFASMGAAFLAVIGALAALHRRHDDGLGRHVWTSLLDGALAYNSMMWGETDQSVAMAANIPISPQQTSSMRLLTRSFQCADGEYLGIHTGALGAFGRAMKVLGIDDRVPPSETGMDIGVPLTPEEIPIIADELPEIFKRKPRSEWVRLFMEADVCAVEHLHATQVYDTPQAIHNEMVVEVEDPVLGLVQQVAAPAKLAVSPAVPPRPAPTIGQHTDDVLATDAGWPAPTPVPVATPDTRPLLQGVRILDLGAFYAGPYSSRLLADLGAEVIKVEPVLGDPLRGIERPFYSAQANKRAIAANLKDSALTKAKDALLGWADIVHHNLRPGAADRLGLGYEDVSQVNPRVVYVHAPGWGSTGPFARRQSFAPMMSGYAGVTFEVAGEFNPPMPPFANEDPGNGMIGAIGMLLALLHRQRTGEGQFVANPQLNATMGHMAHAVRKPDGEVIGAGLLDPLQTGFGPFERLYETADGWVCLVAYEENDRAAVVKTLGVERPDSDLDQADALADAFRTRESGEVVADLRSAGVAITAPVGRNVHAFMNDPEQREIGRVAELPHAVKGAVRELHVLLRVSDAEQVPHRLAPELGEHTETILAELGFSAKEIAALRETGAVR